MPSTSDQFVTWLDSKLVEHGVQKVIPDTDVLEKAYRRAAAVRRFQQIIDKAGEDIAAYAKELVVPDMVRTRLAERLSIDSTLAWDEALAGLIDER